MVYIPGNDPTSAPVIWKWLKMLDSAERSQTNKKGLPQSLKVYNKKNFEKELQNESDYDILYEIQT